MNKKITLESLEMVAKSEVLCLKNEGMKNPYYS